MSRVNRIAPALIAASLCLGGAAWGQTLTLEPVIGEAQEGTMPELRLLVKLDRKLDYGFTAQLELDGAGASAGTDFNPPIVPLTFLPGEILKPVTLSVVDDPEDEPYRERLLASVTGITALDPGQVPGIVNAAVGQQLSILDDDNRIDVSVSGAEEGGAVTVTLRQAFDSELPVTVTAEPAAGSATPGADFDASPVTGTLPQGTTEITLAIPTFEDDEEEGDESFPVTMTYSGPGTTTFDPQTVTGVIGDVVKEVVPVRIEFTEGTVFMNVSGQTFEQVFQHQQMQGTLTIWPDEEQMVLSQANGKDLELVRTGLGDTDFAGIAAGIPGQSATDIGADRSEGWRGGFTVDGFDFDYAMTEQPDGTYAGYGRQQGTVDGGSVLTVHGFRVIPLE